MIHYAGTLRQAVPTVQALFRGYFEQGVNLCELTEIVSLLRREGVGVDGAALTAALAAGVGQAEVASDLRLASEHGIGGVPLFIFNQRYAVEGDQPLAYFARLLDQLRAEDAPHLRAQMPL
ncbi:MAG: DsbA family protein [Pseudomonadota bacterium]